MTNSLEKTAIQSKAVIGGVIALLPLLDLLLSGAGLIPPGGVTAAETAIVAAIGGALSIYGRLTAKKSIRGLIFPQRKVRTGKQSPRA